MIPKRVRWAAMLAFVLQGIFVLTARYRLSYDAYNHMFFGDHYRLDWWSLWEPRWYTGFPVTSYPPLVHQLIGLLSRLVGVDAAFALILWAVLTILPLAVYAFSRVFTGRTVAGYAALGAAVLPSVYQAAHTFGQLPTLTGAVFALFGIAMLDAYLRHGDRLSGALTVALFTAMMASHHATLLFLPWLVAAVLLNICLNQKLDLRSLQVLGARLTLAGFLSAVAGLLVIWPFWVWGLGQSMQTPIDHISRHNYFVDPLAPVIFFLPAYGPLIPLIPFVLWKGLLRKFLGLWFAFLMLFILGLGGTTPLPRWLFGAGWEWLTYDRFSLWASLVLLPFLGLAVVAIRKKIAGWSTGQRLLNDIGVLRLRRWFSLAIFSILGLSAIISGLLPTLLPTQPVQIDMQPIIKFLAEDNRSQWRYVTFGLGDQLAYLSRLTEATTIDGSYHTARGLPELRSSGIGQIDTTYWLPDGFSRLDPILQKSGQRGVRWGFVNRDDYIPILKRNGWSYLTTLGNHIQVWENPQASLPPPVSHPVESPLEQISWGVFPLFSLFLVAALALLRFNPIRGQNILFGMHAFFVGFIPLGLCFWYYRVLVVIDHPGVYFTYDNALVFLCDALALAAFLIWAIGRAFGPRKIHETDNRRVPVLGRPAIWVFGLCLLASFSIIWSQDWRTSLTISIQLWIVFGLFLSLQDRPDGWRSFALGGFSALFLQILIGFWQFGTQATAFMRPLGLNWPGELTSASPGASVVQLANSVRWLRVYGTLPHPNILGGLILVFLAAMTMLYMKKCRAQFLTLCLFYLGCVLLVLTFSRSAWLGFATFAVALAVAAWFRRIDWKRPAILLAVAILGLGLALIPLRDLVFTRIGDANVNTETFSINARTYLAQQALIFFRERPLVGVGIGAFIIQLSQRSAYGYLIEPVHNIFLLAMSELGLPGLLLLLGLLIVIVLHAIRARRVESIVFSALLAGLFVIGLFDHYLWTLAPGRVLAGLVLGLWVGQIQREYQC